MYRERSSQAFDLAPPPRGPALSPSDALRDYLRSGRFNVVRPAPVARPAPAQPKRHILVLQRGEREKSSQPFAFDIDLFDMTVTPWRTGSALAVPAVAVSLVVVDFEDGAYVDTTVYPSLAGALPGVPIIILATSEGPIDRVVALELGADDFMSKPAHPRELQARARSILKHLPDHGVTSAANGMRYGHIELDLVDRAVTTDHGRAKLCNVEFWLLRSLLEARGRPISRDALLDCLDTQVGASQRDPRAIDVIISRLRKKMDKPGCESLIRTVRSHGYCL